MAPRWQRRVFASRSRIRSWLPAPPPAIRSSGGGAVAPEVLARHYSRFRVTERILLTGHSHQAWPDAGFEGQQRAWLDAAELVDDMWERAFAQADAVRQGFARLLDDDPQRIALAANTHELVVLFLSALPLRQRPRLVTTDGEFHTIRRQLDRLAEEGIEVVKVAAQPAATLAERLGTAVDDRTAAVLASAVLYANAHIVPNLGAVLVACTALAVQSGRPGGRLRVLILAAALLTVGDGLVTVAVGAKT